MQKLTAILLSVLLLAASLAGCASIYPYEEVRSPLSYEKEYSDYLYKPNSHVYKFDRLATVSGVQFYYESSMSGGKVDEAIEKVVSVQNFCGITQPIFLSNEAVTHANELQFWVNVKDEASLIGGAYLAWKGEEELPFGCYAGASALLLGKEPAYEGESLNEKLFENPDVKELQHPHFRRDFGKPKERKTAWSFAQGIAAEYLSKHSLAQLLQSTTEDWTEIFESHGAEIPTEYYFPIGDTPFPFQIKTKNFHYFFSNDFEDRFYDDFDFSYGVLRDFALENEAFVDEITTIVIDDNAFPEIVDVYFGNDFITSSLAGYIIKYTDNDRYFILCNTAYAFSHEAAHAINAYRSGFGGHELEEALCNYFPYISEHAYWHNRFLWLEYSGKQIHDKLADTKKSYTDAQLQTFRIYRELYDHNFGKATEETFSPIKYSLCQAALDPDRYTENLDQIYAYSAVRVSLIYFVHHTYGVEGLFQLVKRFDYGIFDGKTFDVIYEEWQAFLDSFLEENILKEWQAHLERYA